MQQSVITKFAMYFSTSSDWKVRLVCLKMKIRAILHKEPLSCIISQWRVILSEGEHVIDQLGKIIHFERGILADE